MGENLEDNMTLSKSRKHLRKGKSERGTTILKRGKMVAKVYQDGFTLIGNKAMKFFNPSTALEVLKSVGFSGSHTRKGHKRRLK